MINNIVIKEKNLSHAWGKAFLKLMTRGVNELQPLIIIVEGFDDNLPIEDNEIRRAVDNSLIETDNAECHTVANTIFPHSLWNQNGDRHLMYQRYLDILPKLRTCIKNRYGLYFERLISYGPYNSKINQLEHIIETYLGGNHRRSALQASILNPQEDHTHQPQRGFPCLQQVIFTPFGDNGLSVTGFYCIQHVYERAYGNYLGLCRLGHFMASEMELELKQMNCFTAIAKLGNIRKTSLRILEQQVGYIFSNQGIVLNQ